MTRRLGLMIGEGTIGWCLAEGRSHIVDLGVRVFDTGRNPKTGLSWAADRRLARIARRRRDRYVRRRATFIAALTQFGLWPADPGEAAALALLDPYQLRRCGLDAPLTAFELGRALFHLNQRRGFQANRGAAAWDADQAGPIARGAAALDVAMQAEGAATLGAYLADRSTKRLRQSDDAPEIFPQRAHVLAEFDRLWAAQAVHHGATLSDAARDRLRAILSFQRPLRSEPAQPCPHYAGDSVLAKAHPLYHTILLWARVNALTLVDAAGETRALTRDQREAAVALLQTRAKYAAASLLRGLPDLEPSVRLHGSAQGVVTGNALAAALGKPALFGPAWLNLAPLRQWEIIRQLLEAEDPDALHLFLTQGCGLDDMRAEAVAAVRLPRGEAAFGETAGHLVLAHLMAAPIDLDAAIARAGLMPIAPDGLARLPYYGEVLRGHMRLASEARDPDERRFGRIAHPPMHLAWRQLQKLVNAIVDRHGLPDRIVVQLSRELKQNRVDQARRRERAAQAAALGVGLMQAGFADTGGNRALLRQWQELTPDASGARPCIYCGEHIAFDALFAGGAMIDRIVPFSKQLDDSAGNRLAVHAACRSEKGSRTPFEAWGSDSERWTGIQARAATLPVAKQLRFARTAIDRAESPTARLWRGQSEAHRLTRLTVRYLQSLYPADARGAVRMVSGRTTPLIAAVWGVQHLRIIGSDDAPLAINLTRGHDYRELAASAAVVALTSSSLLQTVSRAARRAEHRNTDQLLVEMPPPSRQFRARLGDLLARMVTSHKADHAARGGGRDGTTAGRLHQETAYGLTGRLAADGKTPIVTHRIALARLSAADIAHPRKIRDAALREALRQATQGLAGPALRDALVEFATRPGPFHGLRRLRIEEALQVIPVHDRDGRAVKAYKSDSNARWELWRLPDGALHTRVVTLFEAHRPARDARPHPAARLILRLCKNDVIALGEGAGRSLCRVVGFSRDGRLTLAGVNDMGNLRARDRASAEVDPFVYRNLWGRGLIEQGVRQVRVDLLGGVFDPGPRVPIPDDANGDATG